MSARAHLAWNMLVAAEFENQRREQPEFQAKIFDNKLNRNLKHTLSMNSTNNFIETVRHWSSLYYIICLNLLL